MVSEFSVKAITRSTVLPFYFHIENNMLMDEHSADVFCQNHGYDHISYRGKRLIEFAMGRYCASRALGKMGCKVSLYIPKHQSGRPIWPDGLCGSISHSDKYTIAVVADAKKCKYIGIDIEQLNFGKKHAETVAAIKDLALTKQERINYFMGNREVNPVLFFSLKEALYKAISPLVDKLFDFKDVEITDLCLKKQSSSFTLKGNIKEAQAVTNRVKALFFIDKHINHILSLCYEVRI